MTKGHGAKSRQQRSAAILALLEQPTLATAAAQCGVSARKWTNTDEAFKQELVDARRAVFAAGISRIQGLTSKAVDALETCIGSGSEQIKLRAATTALELATYQHESESIVAKLTAIEAQIDAQRQHDGHRK